MANTNKQSSSQKKKEEEIKTDKATTGGGKNKNIGGQSGSMAKGKGDSTGSKGVSK